MIGAAKDIIEQLESDPLQYWLKEREQCEANLKMWEDTKAKFTNETPEKEVSDIEQFIEHDIKKGQYLQRIIDGLQSVTQK
jgi:hypothetical protein